jgi:uncharacterized protein YecE (DUF72 family)
VILIGTSGWQYRDWRPPSSGEVPDRPFLYPAKLPQRLWLEHYAERFAVVEINNAFYRLPERDTFRQWRERTPDDFTFAVKMSRYLTHIKRLTEPAEPVARFMSRAEALGPKLGPVLLQLPPTLKVNVRALEETLARFPRSVRVAVEPRHPSWWIDEVRDLLKRYGAALSWADRRGRPVTPLWRTAGFGYLRMHEGRARPWPRYGRSSLSSWVDRITGDRDAGPVYVFFNNDPGGAAVIDAGAMAGIVRRRGGEISRTP